MQLLPEKRNTKTNQFYTRTLSTLILFPPIFYAIYSGGLLYFMVLFGALLLAGYEWNNICGKWSFGLDGMTLITFVMMSITAFYMDQILLGLIIIIIGAYLTYSVAILRGKSEAKAVFPEHLHRPRWIFIGFIYLAIGFSAMAYLPNLDPYGYTLLWVFLGTIFNDIFAYIFGSIISGKKIAPKISPGKSWSGFIFAGLSTTLLTYLFAILLDSKNELLLMFFGFLLAVFAHIGDFLESWFKRYLQVKDTSGLIPGHGGILDRLDGLFGGAVYVVGLGLILGKSPLFY
ncbi:Phosphatidate cytidylyltransferase [Candidatus Hepatincolaceae symbiont of Richtersius coronifer]